ncbi:MAG TPA: hypothetical protein DDY70_06235 [Clostridiales bacterium]|nr:hypothetical protein [Clostridiales bacterium]
MNVPTFCGVALLLAVAAFTLREFGWRGTPVFVTFGALLLLRMVFEGATPLFRLLSSLGADAGFSETAGITLKILGIGYLTSLTAGICRGLGEGTVAAVTETAGRLGVLLLALPFFEKLIACAAEMLS